MRAARRGLRVVPGVDVVLDQVMPLRVVAVRAAALLVDERVRDRVGADVSDVAEREGQELLERSSPPSRAVVQHLGLVGRAPGRSRRSAGNASCRSTGTRSPGSPSPRRYPSGSKMSANVVISCSPTVSIASISCCPASLELAEDPAGQVVGDLADRVHERADRLVPRRDEVLPDLLSWIRRRRMPASVELTSPRIASSGSQSSSLAASKK